MIKACVFVDGENFRHSICELFQNEFPRENYLPKKANWGDFFDWVVREAYPDVERLRTYWYVVEHVDFMPYKLPRFEENPTELRRILEKDATFKADILAASDGKVEETLRHRKKELDGQRKIIESRSKGWKTIHAGIAIKHNAVEFRQAGSIRYDLFEKKFGVEKAVDVKLATDLITLADIYDIALIVSGDQDYVPAVEYIKNRGKKVVNVSFLTKNEKLLPGGARRLNQTMDKSILVGHAKLKSFLNI